MKKLFLCLLLLPTMVISQIPKPQPHTYINDMTGSLTSGQIYQLNMQLWSLEKETSVQLAIVLVNDLPENMEIDDYAREIGRTWHVGNAKNGIVYVAALNPKKQRLEIADQLQGLIPDIHAKQILRGVKPYFRSKDYYGMVDYVIKEVNVSIKPEAKEQKALGDVALSKKNEEVKEEANNALSIILIIIMSILIIVFVFWIKIKVDKKRQKVIDEEMNRLRRESELRSKEERNKKATNDLLGIYNRKMKSSNSNKQSKKHIPHLNNPKHTIAYERPKPPTSNNSSTLAAAAIGYGLGREINRNDEEDNTRNYSSNSEQTETKTEESNFGNWGNDDPSPSDSGFSGGGASDSLD